MFHGSRSWTASWHLQREPSALTVPPSKYLTFLGPWCPTNMDCVMAHWLAVLALRRARAPPCSEHRGGRKSDHNELQVTQRGKYFPLLLLLKKAMPAAAAAAAVAIVRLQVQDVNIYLYTQQGVKGPNV